MSATASKRSNAQAAQEAAINAVLAAGFIADGETRSETVRMPTAKCPVLNRGKSGGELSTFGGRPRFAFPTNHRCVTIGPRSTCFYDLVRGREPSAFKSFDTKDIGGIAAEARAAGAA